jgi:hypothetical protein
LEDGTYVCARLLPVAAGAVEHPPFLASAAQHSRKAQCETNPERQSAKPLPNEGEREPSPIIQEVDSLHA